MTTHLYVEREQDCLVVAPGSSENIWSSVSIGCVLSLSMPLRIEEQNMPIMTSKTFLSRSVICTSVAICLCVGPLVAQVWLLE